MSYGDAEHKKRAERLGEEPVVACISVSQNISTGETTSYQTYGGLTKREEFAKATMTGIYSNPGYSPHNYQKAAENAIRAAEVLLLELTK